MSTRLLSQRHKMRWTLSGWFRIVGALVVRDFDYQFRSTRSGGIIFLCEPIVLVASLSLVRSVVFDRKPEYGSSVTLFFATGVLPFYFFLRCSRGLGYVRERQGEYRLVRYFDIFVARFLIELIRMTGVSLLIFGVLYAYGIDEAAPFVFERVVLSVGLISAFAFGIGLVNSTVASYFPLWLLLYRIGSRGIMLLSGVAYVVDLLPPYPRSWVVLNPMSHVIELFRWGFYPGYPIASFDMNYLLTWVTGIVVAGIVALPNRKNASSDDHATEVA